MDKKEQLKKELKKLNKAVEKAHKARKEWMDAHMEDFADYKIGEKLYLTSTGECLGTIKSYYRYFEKHNESFDTSMSIDYEVVRWRDFCGNRYYEKPSDVQVRKELDNTSRLGGMAGITFCNKEQLKKRYSFMADSL